jgi:hypothetical protein
MLDVASKEEMLSPLFDMSTLLISWIGCPSSKSKSDAIGIASLAGDLL